ncbi:uridine kinase [Neosynechococcus sphagnicola sy1]|uniref:Uridine kinase n=1 Tax=Neosynechococcus sphagnicola sy1 TaxID=1497020 RepID=A0A098TP80_9CYAN|nr:uridine kinase [Neosynechococcus sphagnicola]KGF73692.1 uridine kinase [Neosynechococcus sphagnicola sy1]
MTDLTDLVLKILNKRAEISTDKSVLVAVSGIDGSGKGYITQKLVSEINQQGVKAIAINIDPWLALPEQRFNPENPGEHFYHHAFVFEDLFQQLIHPLKQHRSIHLKTTLTGEFGTPFTQTYDFQDVDVIVLEGIFLLKRSLRHHYDLTVWVECSFETALERALQRNQEDLSPEAIIHAYHTIYFPAERLHLAVDDPKASVDAIYMNDPR